MQKPTAQQIIDLFQLEPLPVEGGIYRQTYRAQDVIQGATLPPRYPRADKPYGVAILFLFTSDADHFSAMHMLPTDEIFHFYLGDPVQMLHLYPNGQSKRIILGHDVLNGQQVQHLAPAQVWQGSYLMEGGDYALVGTTMAPGFTAADYIGGERAALIAEYPHEADLITRLTRPDAPLHMPDDVD